MPKKPYQFEDDKEEEIVDDRPEDEPTGRNELIIEELGQIAPAVPVRWVDVPDEKRPYRTPEEEFVRSPFPLDMEILYSRWAGLWERYQIEDEYARKGWMVKRWEYQDAVEEQGLQKSLAADAKFVTRIANQDVISMSVLIERLEADLARGVEYRPVRNAGAFAYVQMPLTVESRAKIGRLLIEARKFRGTRVGLVAELAAKESTLKVSIQDTLRSNQAETDPVYAQLLALSGLKSLMPSQAHNLPGQVFEAHAKTTEVPVK